MHIHLTKSTLEKLEGGSAGARVDTDLPADLLIEPYDALAIAAISQAVSLKRIADILERSERALRSPKARALLDAASTFLT